LQTKETVTDIFVYESSSSLSLKEREKKEDTKNDLG